MAAAEFYPEVPSEIGRADLEARVAELERVVATLASLRDARLVERRDERPDPVALTAALHPGGMRSIRKLRRGTPGNGTLSMRFVLFDPHTSR